MGTILDRIVTTKREEVASARTARPIAGMMSAARAAPPARDFHAAVSAPSADGVPRLIAEIKRRSPSAGVIRTDCDPAELARTYQAHGASALSVLTDAPFFDGRLEHLEAVRRVATLPALRKDFLIDEYQLYESRASGADAVLLIVEILTDADLRRFLELADRLQMTALVEIHDAESLGRAREVLAAAAVPRALLGINNRNLRTQTVDIGHFTRLAAQAAGIAPLIAESGIRTHQDMQALGRAGAAAVLVGESLLRAANVGAKLDELLGRSAASGQSIGHRPRP